jgi:SlyX protein
MSVPDAESRLARLEERLAWFERHAAEQDKAVLELAETLERLRRELRAAQERYAAASSSSEPSPGDERPPHH